MLLVILAVIWAVGFAAISLEAGEHLARSANPLFAVLAGVVLLSLAEMIPVLGFLVFATVSLLALGRLALTRFGSRKALVAPVG